MSCSARSFCNLELPSREFTTDCSSATRRSSSRSSCCNWKRAAAICVVLIGGKSPFELTTWCLMRVWLDILLYPAMVCNCKSFIHNLYHLNLLTFTLTRYHLLFTMVLYTGKKPTF